MPALDALANNLSDFLAELIQSEQLREEINTGIENAVMDDGVSRIAR
jgi:hypothetical protein